MLLAPYIVNYLHFLGISLFGPLKSYLSVFIHDRECVNHLGKWDHGFVWRQALHVHRAGIFRAVNRCLEAV